MTALTSPWPEVEIPSEALPAFTLHRADVLADKVAIVDAEHGRGYTYAQLRSAVIALGTELPGRGLLPGDVVALASPNIPEFPIVFLGAQTAGLAVTTLNPLYGASEFRHQLEHSRARLLFTVGEQADRVREAVAGTVVEDIIIIDEPGWGAALCAADVTGSPAHPAEDPGGALAALPYSSGTTGLPKGVMLTHRNLVANVLQTAASQMVVEDDVVVAVLPFFHIYGMTVTMNYILWVGATIVTTRRYEAESFAATLERYCVTRLYAAPPIILDLIKRADAEEHDLSRLRHVMSGAAPLDGETARACSARLGCPVTQGYGMTELSPCSHLTGPADTSTPPGSIGPALGSTQCRIIDPESGRDVEVGRLGELLVRGPQVMRGYLDDEDATRRTIDEDGFLHTGDIARVDEQGHYYIVDRLKELIKFNGFQVAPAELEAVLIGHGAILDAAVIGVPDPTAGELPKALVVVAEPVEAEEIIRYVASRVSPQKRIRLVEFVDAIPKSASGKILRRELRARERSDTRLM